MILRVINFRRLGFFFHHLNGIITPQHQVGDHHQQDDHKRDNKNQIIISLGQQDELHAGERKNFRQQCQNHINQRAFINGIASQAADAYTPSMSKWEYKVVKRADVSEEILNTLGAEGWELMNFVLPHANIPGSFDEIEVEIVLRRPVS